MHKISWLPENYVITQTEFNRTTMKNTLYNTENADIFDIEEMFKQFGREKCLIRKVSI